MPPVMMLMIRMMSMTMMIGIMLMIMMMMMMIMDYNLGASCLYVRAWFCPSFCCLPRARGGDQTVAAKPARVPGKRWAVLLYANSMVATEKRKRMHLGEVAMSAAEMRALRSEATSAYTHVTDGVENHWRREAGPKPPPAFGAPLAVDRCGADALWVEDRDFCESLRLFLARGRGR